MSDENSWGSGWGGSPSSPQSGGQPPQDPSGAWPPQGPPPTGQPGWDQQAGWSQQPQGAPPFGQQPPNYAQQPYAQQPYAQPPFGQQPFGPPSNNNRTAIIVVSIVGGLLLLVGIAVFALFGFVGSQVEEFTQGGQFTVPDLEGNIAQDIPGGPRLLDVVGSVSGSSSEFYDFTVERSGTIQIDVLGEDGFDPVVTLREQDGTYLDENDDGGGFLDSQLTSDLSEGIYTIEVQGFGSSSGSFQVLITRP